MNSYENPWPHIMYHADTMDVPTEVENPKGNGKKDCEAVLINLFLKGFS